MHDASIRDLKRRYKTGLALGRLLPTSERAISLPFSTGEPLYDAALTNKLVATSGMNEPEHLNRAWHLVRTSTPAQRAFLAGHARSLLNDYNQLLALKCLVEGEDDLRDAFLKAMPWRWRLAFPTTAIKPAATIFTGWRKSLDFRLIDPPFAVLRELFRATLAAAPGVAILKYRKTIKESAALLKFRFEGEREQAIHDLCFNNGKGMPDDASLEPIGTFLRARAAFRADGPKGYVDVLGAAEREIPITSFMGLLGSAGAKLTDDDLVARDALRDYAVRCATPVESLLRLAEWSPWMSERHAEEIARTVRHGIIERGIDVPFFKVLKAYMNAPLKVRKMVREPLLLPLMHHFGARTAGMLRGTEATFVMPGNLLHATSFLLHAVLGTAMKTKLLLLFDDGIEEAPELSLESIGEHLADDRKQLEAWLLKQLGGITTTYGYTYDYAAAATAIGRLDPDSPLMLDLPFARSMELLGALRPFEQVFNLNTPFGAPGEVTLEYRYYATMSFRTRGFSYNVWERVADSAAGKLAEMLQRLEAFRALAGAA